MKSIQVVCQYRNFVFTEFSEMKNKLITNKTIVFCLSLDYNAIRKNALIMMENKKMRHNFSDTL